MITIKKYSNRRLYDTSQSQYITLEELAGLIRGGEDVEVIDAKSKEELTQAVLAQIIIESRGAARLLPTKMLMQLIRMEDDALAEFFGQYMSWALAMYLRLKRRAERIAPYNPMATPFAAPNALAQWMQALYDWPGFRGRGGARGGGRGGWPGGGPGGFEAGQGGWPGDFDESIYPDPEDPFAEEDFETPPPEHRRRAPAGAERAEPEPDPAPQHQPDPPSASSEVAQMRQELDELKVLLRQAVGGIAADTGGGEE